MPHKEDSSEFTPNLYPPFPDDLPTVELETISLNKLHEKDGHEMERVFEACKTRGFFYLELPGSEQGETILNGADDIARVAEQIFYLPVEEKMKYALGGGDLFGYKKVGQTVVDKNRTADTAEFFNVGKNDMIVDDNANMSREWPALVLENKPLFARYSTTAHAIGLAIVNVLAEKLGIDPEEIRSRHLLAEPAGDHIRMTRGPPREVAEMPEIQTPSHTDFGTITILMNWLGGLQVWSNSSRSLGPLDPDSDGQWLWVRPKPRCAIVNLGDAAVKFTNGVLCSGRHRVVPGPGHQGTWPRYSIVYFVRPNDHCHLKTLKGPGVPPAADHDDVGVNAKEWIFRQSEALRGAYN